MDPGGAKRVSAPGRRGTTKPRAAFKADAIDGEEDALTVTPIADSIVAAAAAVPVVAAAPPAAPVPAPVIRTAVEPVAVAPQMSIPTDLPLPAPAAASSSSSSSAAAEAAAEAAERERLAEEAELRALQERMAERERKRQEALAQIEADRIRAEEAAAAEAARFQAAEAERQAAQARAVAEQEAREMAEETRRREADAARLRAEAAVVEAARAEKAAKEREWQALLEAEAAEQERQRELQAQAEAQQRAEQERLRREAALEQERLRLEREREEAERLHREEQARIEAEAAAAIAEEAAQRQRELDRLAAIRREELAREEAEAEAQRRKLEEQRKKRQSFLDTTDSFSADLATKTVEKESAILSVKQRESSVIASEINAQSSAYVAPAPKQRSVFDDAADVPQPKPVVVAATTTSTSAKNDDLLFGSSSSSRPAAAASKGGSSLFGDSGSDFVFPTDTKPAAAADRNSNFENLTSSLFASSDSPSTSTATATPAPASQNDLFGESSTKASKSDSSLFGESEVADSLFANRTFAVKNKKSKGTSSTTTTTETAVSTTTTAKPAATAAAAEESNVDWDDLEATGKTDGLTGEMEQLWKARQIDITTRRKEFGGAVCYGLGGIFAWQMYSTAESRDSLGKPYIEYIMRCQWGTKWENMQPWLVARRYREFDSLDTSLRREYPHLTESIIPLPGKGILTLGVVNLAERTAGIEHYIIHILNNLPQVLKSRTIDAFFDIGERIQLIKRKIREADSAEGIAPESKKMPAPGTRAELGGAAPSTTSNTSSSASGSGSAAAKVSASRSSAFGDDDVSTFRPAAPVSADSEVVPPLTLEEIVDEPKAEKLRLSSGCGAISDDALGILEENVRDLISLAKKTKPKDLQTNKRFIKQLRMCMSQWPALRACCAEGIANSGTGASATSMLVPRALQAEEDLGLVVKEVKSVLQAQAMGSPLHFF